MTFSLTTQENILEAIRKTNRKTCILIELETDVCVAQSALGLMQEDYQVIVVTDATASPRNAHETRLKRIEDAGGLKKPSTTNGYE